MSARITQSMFGLGHVERHGDPQRAGFFSAMLSVCSGRLADQGKAAVAAAAMFGTGCVRGASVVNQREALRFVPRAPCSGRSNTRGICVSEAYFEERDRGGTPRLPARVAAWPPPGRSNNRVRSPR